MDPLRFELLGRQALQRSGLGLALALALLPLSAAAAEEPDAYSGFQQYRYSGPFAIPEGGVSWRVGGAEWRLLAGEVWLMAPTVEGAVTGAVFSGAARFEMSVPDRLELRQLRRFAERENLQQIDLEVSELVLRWSGAMGHLDGIEALVALALGGAAYSEPEYREHRRARERHRLWRRFEGHDADARVLAGLLNGGDEYLRADMKSKSFDWLTYEFDGLRPEEIELTRFRSGRSYVESWLSLDRRRERDEDGRPTSEWTDGAARLVHFASKVDGRQPGKSGAIGVGEVNPVRAKFETTATFESKLDPLRALQLSLASPAEVKEVSTSDGYPLEFARAHLRDRFYDSSLLVVLPRALSPGEQVELVFRYEMEIPNYAPLLSWYPRPRSAGLERHTMRLELTHRKDYAVKAVGRLVEEVATDGGQLTVYESDEPLHGAGFTLARVPYEKSYSYDGLPEITMFGTQAGYLSAEKIELFSADVINAVNYFQQLFQSPVQSSELRVTLIASGHGQAMEGLIHVSDAIAQAAEVGRAVVGTREAFLAHEVAHEWWGHQVSWASYRDQWLSEGFAEYSSMMFVEASLEDGPKIFQGILKAYTDELTGSIRSAFGAFARPGLALMNRAARERVGPIGHGRRCGTVEAPAAYASMAYTKGAMVLHMLRTILRGITRSDDTFLAVLRDFVATHRGGAASTADFEAALMRHAPSDWSWFFDQWVYGTAIPTYSWSHKVQRIDDGWLLVLEIEQEDVPAGFKSPVPVRVDLGGGRVGEQLVMVDKPHNAIQIRLPEKPRKVWVNPDHGILAKMR